MGYPHIRGTVVAAEWQPSFIHLWLGIECPDFLRPFEDTPPPSAIVTLEYPYAHSGVAVGFFCALGATPLPWPSYVLKFTSNRFQNMEEPKMYDRRSIYALNKKNPDAIVLPDADGNLICLTCADFTDEAEFRRWKRWSDQDFHAEDKSDVEGSDHTTSMDMVPEAALAVPNEEALAEERQVREAQIRCAEAAVSGIRSILTGAQFYRLRQYCIEGKTESEITEAEGVTQQAVSKSLVSALKKRENF